MCWPKNLFVFLNVAVRRPRARKRARPAVRPLRAQARSSARPAAAALRARSARMPGGEGFPHPAKMKRDCMHANIFQMSHSLQNIRLTKNISHNTASRYLDILRGMITDRHIQSSHKSWVNKSATLESKGKILVGF